MNFSVGDVLLDRFRLVEILRNEPSISVWIAHDNTLQRNCEIFIVANSTIISRVNAAASALALSQDPHFTRVLHLYRDGEVCVIVTDIDSGITVRDYLTNSQENSQDYPLSTDAVRSIIGELTHICEGLDANNQAHYCIDDITVRLTDDRVVLANFPVSAALLPPTAPRLKATNHDVESVMVYQIAAVAFELLTGTAYTSILAPQARRMLRDVDTPADLELICIRGLALPDDHGRTPVPLVTLLEMQFLLDSYDSLHDLAKNPQVHINITGRPSSAPSITQAVFRRVDAQAIAPLPRSLRENPDATAHSEQFQEWSASELIFGGNNAVDITKPDTSTDLFHALGELDATKLERVYDPYDFNDFVEGDTKTVGMDTQAIRIASDSLASSRHPENSSESEGSHAESSSSAQDEISTGSFSTTNRSRKNVSRETSSSYEPKTEVIPPSFVPRPTQRTKTTSSDAQPASATPSTRVASTAASSGTASPSADSSVRAQSTAQSDSAQSSSVQSVLTARFEQLWEKLRPALQTRAAVIIGVALVLIILVSASMYSLFAGQNSLNNNTDPWSQISQETVRFPGQENNKGSNTPSTSDDSSDKSDSQKSDNSKSDESKNTDSKKSDSQKTTATFDDSKIQAEKLPKNKSVSAVPTPAGTSNSTAINPRGYTYLERPAGIRGWGYSFAFDQPTTIWRAEIGNQTGGGQVHIYADPTIDDPRSGTEVATFSFADNNQPTNVIFKKPVTASTLVVWIDGTDTSTLPQVIRLTHYAFY